MTVWVIEAYSYDPEPVQGVFSSKEKAEAWLTANGWKRTDNYANEWTDGEGWMLAHIVGHEVQ